MAGYTTRSRSRQGAAAPPPNPVPETGTATRSRHLRDSSEDQPPPPPNPVTRTRTATKRNAAVDRRPPPANQVSLNTRIDNRFEYVTPPPPSESKSSNVAYNDISKDTPMAQSSHGPDAGHANVAAEEAIVKEELRNHIHEDPGLAKTAFSGKVPSDSKIRSFLKKSKFYDILTKTWRSIKPRTQKEEELYAPMRDIMEEALDHFGYSNTRKVLATHNVKVNHKEGSGDHEDGTELKTSPDVIIGIRGFEDGEASVVNPTPTSDSAHAPSYLHCASPVEIKTQKNRTKDDVFQVAIYARQCFIQQHNRKAVYSLIITEQYVRLYLFDRSGVHHSPDIDIHQDAVAFIRLILGVASPDDEVLGFDTSLFWKNGKRFLQSPENVLYELASPEPVFSRRAIRGRGTCCWKVIDPTGKVFLVKDAWRSKDRTPEQDFFNAAQDLVGVGKMISFHDGSNTAALRGKKVTASPSDRTFTRFFFEDGGKPIHRFQSAGEVLYAFRDAIAGHQRLWDAGILHRDVSANNVLIGPPGSKEGSRGVIIDLDLAIWLEREKSLKEVDFRTGTRAFQSVNVLNSYYRPSVPHDHLDDLESFFYVLCWVSCGHDKTRQGKIERKQPFPEFLSEWEHEDAKIAARSKESFYLHGFEHKATGFFGEVFQGLLEELFEFFEKHFRRRLWLAKNPPHKTLVELKPEAVEHYQTVLGIIDRAIAKYDEAAAKRPDPPKTPSKPPRPASYFSLSPSRKRCSESDDSEAGSPLTKKSRRSLGYTGRPPPLVESPGSTSESAGKPLKFNKHKPTNYKPTRPTNLSQSFSYGDDD